MATSKGQRRVIMTGAAGGIGTAIVPVLAPLWDLRLTDRVPGDQEVLDVTDGEACRRAFAGADAVVHLAANPRPNAPWEDLLEPNLVGAYQVAQAALGVGVRRLVLASSLQAVMGYPRDLQRRSADAPRPANLYGATKAWSEALGSWVAASSPTTVVALRIGYFLPYPPPADDPTPSSRSAWLSPGDCARLVRCAVEADVEGMVVVNGISANRYRAADLADAGRAIGYEPLDDAWAGA